MKNPAKERTIRRTLKLIAKIEAGKKKQTMTETETETEMTGCIPDRDWVNRLTHALLLALPASIEMPDGTTVRVIRADDPDQLSNPDDADDMVSPLFVNQETTATQIVLEFERPGYFSALFAIQQIGGMHLPADSGRAPIGQARDRILPAAVDPIENP